VKRGVDRWDQEFIISVEVSICIRLLVTCPTRTVRAFCYKSVTQVRKKSALKRTVSSASDVYVILDRIKKLPRMIDISKGL